MSAPLIEDLGQLDGGELFHLLCKLSRARVAVAAHLAAARDNVPATVGYLAVSRDVCEAWDDTAAQMARITAPLAHAERLIAQARHRHRSPVRVPGT